MVLVPTATGGAALGGGAMKYLDYGIVSCFDPRIVAWTSEGNNVWTRHGPFSVVVLPTPAQRQRPGDLQAGATLCRMDKPGNLC